MKKYWSYFLLSVKNSLEYRGELVAWVVFEVLSLSSAVFMWFAVFRDNAVVGGFDFNRMIQYYFFIPIVGAISSAHIINYLPKDIKNGDISKEIIKPYSIFWTRIVHQAAVKLVQNTVKIPVYIVVGIWLTTVTPISFNILTITVGVFAAFIAFFVHCLFDLAASSLAFWLDDSWALNLIKQVSFVVFGGIAYPISLVPDSWRLIYDILPFDLFYYFPASLMMGSLNTSDIRWYFSKIIIWTIVLVGFRNHLWKKGIKTYCAYGQ